MIKAVLDNRDGSKTVLLGLSRENTNRLHQDMPIKVDLAEFGLDTTLSIVLIGGETEGAILNDVQAALHAAGQQL